MSRRSKKPAIEKQRRRADIPVVGGDILIDVDLDFRTERKVCRSCYEPGGAPSLFVAVNVIDRIKEFYGRPRVAPVRRLCCR